MHQKIIHRGGNDPERLYIKDLEFDTSSGERVVVTPTDHPGINMSDLVARHLGRYYLLGHFCRPGHVVLDFPCGSGYASEVLKPLGIIYEGVEYDPITVEYAQNIYGTNDATFRQGDLTAPHLPENRYDVIGCIEGLEHIDKEYQLPLLKKLYAALKPGGTLVVSSPENPTGTSGPSVHNKHHKHELTKKDFIALLHTTSGPENVELITQKATLSTGVHTTCFYGVCHKPSLEK